MGIADRKPRTSHHDAEPEGRSTAADPHGETAAIGHGRSTPLGATARPDGVNFALYAPQATAVELLLFAEPLAAEPAQVIPLPAPEHRTGAYWHAHVAGLQAGQVYAYRVDGPADPPAGLCFDREKVLIDPYARAIVGLELYDRRLAAQAGDNCATALRSVVAPVEDGFDWTGDQSLPPPAGREVIYELHVGGFTASPSSAIAAQRRGTFVGLIEKIPYLQQLGVTAVELLPIHCYDPQDARPGLENYWGYSTIGFFAPHPAYSSDRSPLGPLREFKELVRALHAAGIRVILDVVYNHTAEVDATGPTLSYRGLADGTYYHRDEKGEYANYSGCGNAVNANHPVVGRLILDSLRYWADEMHVDGFRFDLASILTRDQNGVASAQAPVIWSVELDPLLADRSLIAEAWDAAGLYQVGHFPGTRFAEWNGPYRDDIRRFLRGDEDTIESLMARLVGSPDLFAESGRRPGHSVNFVTCHDGFTLQDLVSYDRKHNEANGENNQDGSDQNVSWNCGVEGPTDAPEVLAIRRRQVRNALCLLLLSHGTPLLSMGDEVLRTQQGNNNAYCQNNALAWFDWLALESQADFLRFARLMIAFSQDLPLFAEDRYWHASSPDEQGDISWHGTEVAQPDWRPSSRSLAFTLHHPGGEQNTHVMLNAWSRPLTFTLPDPPAGKTWRRVVDTARPSPADLSPLAEAEPINTATCKLEAHSVIVLHAG